jgi:hypothetical protein
MVVMEYKVHRENVGLCSQSDLVEVLTGRDHPVTIGGRAFISNRNP